MTRHYETVYIFDSALEEAQVNERLERFHALLTSPDQPAQIASVNHWGKRPRMPSRQGNRLLRGQISRFRRTAPEYERHQADDGVLRHLMVSTRRGPRPRGRATMTTTAA
jgi:ribosomal protein S6